MSEITVLKKQRKLIRGAFTRILNYCKQSEVQLEQVHARMERAEDLFMKYEDVQNQIDQALAENTESAAEEQYRAEMEEAFFDIKAVYYRLQNEHSIQRPMNEETHDNSELAGAMQALVQHQASMNILVERFANNMRTEDTSTPHEHAQQQQQRTEFQLPRIEIPEFDGSLLDWIRFKELFEALVHNKSSLANVEKLEYLHSKLKGEALLVIKHLKPANSNYSVAWELLNKKYNNIENVKAAYMKLIFEQPAMKAPSLTEIKRLYNNINEGFNALKALDESVCEWSGVLLFNMEKKLDHSTAMLCYGTEKKPTFDNFFKFIEERISELESIQGSHQHHQHYQATKEQKRAQTRTYTAIIHKCPVCSSDHQLFLCDEFKKLKVEQRRNIVQQQGLCFNCLHDNHKANQCRSSSCRKCNKRHNTLLHLSSNADTVRIPQTSVNNVTEVPASSNNEITNTCTSISSNNVQRYNACVILPTALIMVLDIANAEQPVRALLDSGSQSTLVTEACVQRLRLKKFNDKTMIYGLGSSSGKLCKGSVKLKIKTANKIINITALCLPSLTQNLPTIECNNEQLQYFKNMHMADPHWYKTGTVDIILGADVFLDCCLSQIIQHTSGSPTALNTIFGWVLMGKISSQSNNIIMSNHVSVNLEQQLQKFWELEDIQPTAQILSPEEEEAEQLFTKTTTRDKTGKYIVKLHFKNSILYIGESKNTAMKRLIAMERKFKQQPNIGAEYKKFMNEYMQLGHMETIDETSCEKICFLPHHAVIKPNSTTTKLRVVFDASSKTSNGKSLNDNLLVGPKVQNDLFDIIISFRMRAIAITGDIEKMYRQILVHTEDRPLQCILWRTSETEQVTAFRLNTVTYGTACAAFLATRALKQVAYDNNAVQSQTTEAIKQNFYVDDFMYSADNVRQAIELKNELSDCLSKAGFNIRKWSSNSNVFLHTIPNKERAITSEAEIQQASTVSTLGLVWNTIDDHFKYSIIAHSSDEAMTKRTTLSEISKIYDPMGWIAPIVIPMKVFIQKLWLKGIGWDEQLTADLHTEWVKLRYNIDQIAEIKVSRSFQYNNESKIELHGFSDASELAYAAAVYAKVYPNNSKPTTHLIAAKTRVCPVKQISIPRLELCGAHLLTKLMSRISSSMRISNIPMDGWTDSSMY